MPNLLLNIKELCVEKGITPADLERSAGLCKKTIYAWSRTVPAADKLLKVAKVLDCTVEELMKDCI